MPAMLLERVRAHLPLVPFNENRIDRHTPHAERAANNAASPSPITGISSDARASNKPWKWPMTKPS